MGQQMPALTVGELKALLAGCADDLPVVLDGCDCAEDLGSVSQCREPKLSGEVYDFVYLRRADHAAVRGWEA